LYYLTLMDEALNYYSYESYEIICYCLMENHVHILIKTQEAPIGPFIGRLNSKYAKFYNKKYNHTGHLFQDRYYSGTNGV
jgi:putative transposase